MIEHDKIDETLAGWTRKAMIDLAAWYDVPLTAMHMVSMEDHGYSMLGSS
jgi:hypothetical protein